MPSPRWANAVPQVERGRPRARANAVLSGTLSTAVRSTRSVSAPAIANTASPKPNATSTGPPPSAANVAAPQITASAAAPTRRDAEQVAALPGQQRPERRRHQQRQEQQPEHQVEERSSDRDLVAGQRLERERIERAKEHAGAGADQEQIVEHERTLARDRREQA